MKETLLLTANDKFIADDYIYIYIEHDDVTLYEGRYVCGRYNKDENTGCIITIPRFSKTHSRDGLDIVDAKDVIIDETGPYGNGQTIFLYHGSDTASFGDHAFVYDINGNQHSSGGIGVAVSEHNGMKYVTSYSSSSYAGFIYQESVMKQAFYAITFSGYENLYGYTEPQNNPRELFDTLMPNWNSKGV